MRPTVIEAGQLWRQDLYSGTRVYLVLSTDGQLGLQINLLDLERGSLRSVSLHGMMTWDSWSLFEP